MSTILEVTAMEFTKIEKIARIRKTAIRAVTYILLSFWALLVLFPFYWMVLTSFKSYSAYNSEFVPQLITMSHLAELF